MSKNFLNEIKHSVKNISFSIIPVDRRIIPTAIKNVLEKEFEDMTKKDCFYSDSVIVSYDICFDE